MCEGPAEEQACSGTVGESGAAEGRGRGGGTGVVRLAGREGEGAVL